MKREKTLHFARVSNTSFNTLPTGQSPQLGQGQATAPIIPPKDYEQPSIVGAVACPCPSVGCLSVAWPCILLVLFVCLFFLFPLGNVYASATSTTGNIYGQLLDGTNKNAPVVGQNVILQMAQGTSTRDLTNVTTDAHGVFSFANLATDKTIGYAVYTLYQGAQYYTDLIYLNTTSVQNINLSVYEATANANENIALVQDDILFHEPDSTKGTITISEYCFFRNIGKRTYVGSLDASHGKPNALLFSLPLHARNIALDKSFNGYHVIPINGGFATDAALPPGDTQFAFSFEVPYTSSIYDFSHTVNYPTVTLSLLVPPDIHTRSSKLISQGVVASNQVWRATGLLPPADIHALFQDLPAPSDTSNASALNPSTLWLLAGLLALMAIIVVSTFVYRLTNRTPKKHSSFKRQSASSSKGQVTTPRRKALLQELVKLDKDFEEGKISKVIYQEQRAKKKAQLRTLMNEESEPLARTSNGPRRRSS